MKIVDSRKAKVTKKTMLIALSALVASLAFVAPKASVKAYAASNEEVLFEDDTDDYTTEKIDNNDVVENNTVVQDGDKVEETKTEEQPKTEEKKNDGGDCVTEDHGYNEEAGKYWDPSIKTEVEKKGLTPDTPSTPVTPPSTPETPSTPSTPVTPEQPVVTPAPKPTPKTGDLSSSKLALIYGAVGLMSLGAASLAYVYTENKLTKKRK